ncbi:UL1 [Gallid alphaherpesvirus 2]|uniref:Envelope glycoprotein L n=11 Tax=Gallid alphaherpesvirus 2 TaxID=10390 RepID=GL_GAHVM|nr:envelope glycoprotein L [Gallid alphaherpesvirus 2]P52510.1 RecName: Full=Envelope glycoprotein L; Short=gL; Flags: Precursor [Marek's disease herpesvirus strain GA]Q77MS8.1 RecName: Full=Envelope glycoprotein L; Short=gL; Flags: Precursor [Marek's disease herpesvirus type 1 strain MD5]ACF49637.1 UL1 [synthetic construct]AEV54979.1 UL1 [Gallid herpesvirus 2 strain 814]AAA61506.1 homolog of HSV-1 glycoprotein L, Swiss Prot Accession Number P10185 [Gallid alphaherpesvirus 2]AAF66737.1 glycop
MKIYRVLVHLSFVLGMFTKTNTVLAWSKYDLVHGFMRVANISSIMRLDCLPNLLSSNAGYAALPSDDIPTGIFIKVNCSIPEFILWYEQKAMAAWINPIMGTVLMMNDVLKSGLENSVKVGLLTFLKRIAEKGPNGPLRNRGSGCINLIAPADISCYGSTRLDRFNRDFEDDSRGMPCRAKAMRRTTSGSRRANA